MSSRHRNNVFLAGGRITAVTCCDDSQSVASGSSDGSLHVWRVEHTCRAAGAPDRYTGVTAQRQVHES